MIANHAGPRSFAPRVKGALRGLGYRLVGADSEAGEPGTGDVGQQRHPVGGDAGVASRGLVLADGEKPAPPNGVAKGQEKDNRQRNQRPHRIRHPGHGRAAHPFIQLLVGAEVVNHLVVGKHHRHGAQNRQHSQGHHKGRQAHIGDEPAANQPGQGRRAHAGQKPDPQRMPGLHHQAGDDPAQPHQRAHRQVNPAGDDDRRHPQRHDAEKREVAGGVVNVALRGEDIRHHAHHQAQNHDGRQHPERLRAGQRAQRRALAPPRDIRQVDQRRAHARSIAPVMRPVTSSGDESETAFSATIAPRRSTAMRSQT